MRRTCFVIGGATLALAGCGGGKQFANLPRPPAPINVTVYIDDSHVSISPVSAGGGPLVFIVTNSSTHSESLQVQPSDSSSGQPLADTGPISPQETATVKIDLGPGRYEVLANGSGGATEAQQALPPSIQPATLEIAGNRPSGKNLLLQP